MKMNEDKGILDSILQSIGIGGNTATLTPAVSAPTFNEEDMMSKFQNIADGGAPDIKSLYQMRKSLAAPPEPKKTRMEMLADWIHEAALADAADPGHGFMGGWAQGAEAINKRDREKSEKSKASQQENLFKAFDDMLKLSTESSKNMASAKDKEVLNTLRKAQTAKALREPTGKAPKEPKKHAVNKSIKGEIDAAIAALGALDPAYEKKLREQMAQNYVNSGDLINSVSSVSPSAADLEEGDVIPGTGIFGFNQKNYKQPKGENAANKAVVDDLLAKGVTHDFLKRKLKERNLSDTQIKALLKK
jgi:hypothetical protein